jgi:transposase
LRLSNPMRYTVAKIFASPFYLFEFEQNVRTIARSIDSEYPVRRQNEGRFSLLTINPFKMKILKQVVGIDVAQKELVVSFGIIKDDVQAEILSNQTFSNTKEGFLKLLSWVKKMSNADCNVHFVMEATGVYHESLAYFLDERSMIVSIVLPNKISNYFKTLDVKTITDNTSAQTIVRFGLERKLEPWKRPKPIFKSLRQLTRERNQIIEERTMAKNHLHAELAEAEPNESSIIRIKDRIKFLDKQEKQVRVEITKKAQDPQIKNSITVMSSIPGIATLTAATVLAETNGFELIRNKKQITSYAGLDVKEKQSGTSIKGKPRISKRGNKHLRKCLYMPGLATIRFDQHFKGIYARLVSRHGIKMKAAVAVQRKVLELMYTLYKKNEIYDANYESKQNSQKRERQLL